MTISAAALRGFLFGVVGTTSAGAIWGAINGSTLCAGCGDSLNGAIIVGAAALIYFALPTGVVGALVMAFIAVAVGEKPESTPARKPKFHPLDD